MRHYCTYFDGGFLIQGLALWRSLAKHDTDSVLWVLALDDFTAETLREIGGTWMRVVTLAELEAGDAGLAAAKVNRTRIEYYFTLSPCWPRWLLATHSGIDRVTYLDADVFFFASPEPVFDAMDAAGASVLITVHRFPAWLGHYERHGKFNVGILSFRNDEPARACLDDWRGRCLAWCYDRLEDGKYADQKYLDEWPSRFGRAVLVLDHPGVNLAPWNWSGHRYEAVKPVEAVYERRGNEEAAASLVGGHRPLPQVDGRHLILFHFARFRPIRGDWWWHSGQLDYGVMPRRLRNALYGPYWRALVAARAEIRARSVGFDFNRRPVRLGRDFFRTLPLRGLFGTDWLRVGDSFFSARAGLGRWSGRALAAFRRLRNKTPID